MFISRANPKGFRSPKNHNTVEVGWHPMCSDFACGMLRKTYKEEIHKEYREKNRGGGQKSAQWRRLVCGQLCDHDQVHIVKCGWGMGGVGYELE